MTVKEVKQALGSWELYLRPYTPREIVDAIQANPFGHIAIVPGRINPKEYGDGLLALARYVGVFRSFFNQPDDHYEIKGAGMAFWLGDEDEKGDVFETPVSFIDETFANTVRGLLPPNGSITEGTLHTVPGGQLYTGKHVFQSPRKAITYVTDTFSTPSTPVEWRANGDGTLDAGPVANLYQTTPRAILVEKDAGRDLTLTGLQSTLSNDYDVEDYTTRVVLLGEGQALGAASGPATPYKDIHGNAVKMTRLVSETATESGNANARATVELNKYAEVRRAAQISTEEYDVKGDFVVGDYIWVFDPDAGFTDTNNEIYWRGVPINPIKLRVVEMTWPVRANWTVAFRTTEGEWLDLSDYYRSETGASYVVVGDFLRTLAGAGSEPITGRPVPDTSVPAAPVFTSFSTGIYQSQGEQTTKALIRAEWTTPLNIDGSTVTDGDHYEIRYRANQNIGYTIDWDTLCGYDVVLTEPFDTPLTDAWPAGWTNVGGANGEYDVVNNYGLHTPAAVNSSRLSARTAVAPTDLRIEGKVATSQVATGGAINGGFCVRRSADGNNHLRVTILFQTDGSTVLRLSRLGGAGSADLVSVNLPWSYVADQDFWIAIQMIGTDIKAMAWPDAASPPSAWQIETTETSITSGHIAARSNLFTGNTNVGASIKYASIQVVDLATTGGFTWDDIEGNSWDALLNEPVAITPEWLTNYIGWGTNAFTIQELTPGVQYELQIRGVDGTNPPQFGPWSASSLVLTLGDIIPPSTPAEPIVAASRIAIQLTHRLGKSVGGTFNLESDLHHLDVHVGGAASFLPSDDNKVGTMPGNKGMMLGQIASVATFQIEQVDNIWVRVVAVDQSGNKSEPSSAVQATVDLIDDAHISDLTVSKITAGTITANWLLAAAIRTADAGARVEMDGTGIRSYNAEGSQTFMVDSNTGDVEIVGHFLTGLGNGEVEISGGFGAGIIRFDAPSKVAGQPDYSVFLWGTDHPVWGGQQLVIQTIQGQSLAGTEAGSEINVGVNNLELLHRDPFAFNSSAVLNLGIYPGSLNEADKGMISFRGAYGRNARANSDETFFVGWTSIAGGTAGVTWNYGSTSPWSNVVLSGGASDVNVWCSSSTATSFTITTNPSASLRNVHYCVIGTKDLA